MGFLLWRESRKRSDAEAKAKDLVAWKVRALALQVQVDTKNARIQALEEQLADIDPSALFDDLVGVPSPGNTGSN